MHDKYSISIKQQERFFLGYLHISTARPPQSGLTLYPDHLFTTLRILYFREGSASWLVGKTKYTVNKGDILFLNNINSRRLADIYSPKIEYDVYAFPVSVFSGQSQCLELFYSPDKRPFMLVQNSHPHYQPAQAYLSRLHDHILSDKRGSKYTCSLLSGLLVSICSTVLAASDTGRSAANEQAAQYNSAQIAAQAIDYINKNFSSAQLNTDTLSGNFGFSEAHFCKLFKKYTDTTPSKFLVRRRVANVINLLSTTDTTVTNAAFASGFNSLSGFYKAFKNLTGHTPGEALHKKQL